MSKKTPASAKAKDSQKIQTPKAHTPEWDGEHDKAALLSSPRSVEACWRQGFDH